MAKFLKKCEKGEKADVAILNTFQVVSTEDIETRFYGIGVLGYFVDVADIMQEEAEYINLNGTAIPNKNFKIINAHDLVRLGIKGAIIQQIKQPKYFSRNINGDYIKLPTGRLVKLSNLKKKELFKDKNRYSQIEGNFAEEIAEYIYEYGKLKINQNYSDFKAVKKFKR